MLNPTTIYADQLAEAKAVPLVHGRELPRPSRGLTPSRSTQLISVDELLARHTATKAHNRLSAANLLQSIATGAPLWAADLSVTGLGFIAANWVAARIGLAVNPGEWLQLPSLLLAQTILLWTHQLYPGCGLGRVEELRGIVRSTACAFILLAMATLAFRPLAWSDAIVPIIGAITVVVALPLTRFLLRGVLARTDWWGFRTLLIGTRADCMKVVENPTLFRRAGYIPVASACLPDSRPTGLLDDAWRASEIAFDLSISERSPVAMLVSAQASHLQERLMFTFPSVVCMEFEGTQDTNREAMDLVGNFAGRRSMPLMRFTPRMIKRCLDLAIAVSVLVVMSIPMLMIAIAIKLTSPGPVIYGSARVGQYGRRFLMWKFRSMVADADEVLRQKLAHDEAARIEWQQNAKLKDDPRVIPWIGSLLRRYSLDELPQLWNVLTGEMSIVGPRPVPPDEIIRYQSSFFDYTKMWPGLTGLWQVSGRNETSFSTRVRLVRHYAANWSPWLDAWILAKTPIVVLAKKGAY